jgi:hypothetical protein
VLVALQLQPQAAPATNLAGCTGVNGKCISHKYVPGTGSLLDLVAMLITDVHMRNGPQVRRQNLLDQRRAIFFSSLQGCTRHALPSPANGQYHHQPYQLLRSGKTSQPVVRQAVGCNLVAL